MIRCYVADHQRDWEVYVQALIFSYNTAVHRTTGYAPFELVIYRSPTTFSLQSETQNIKVGAKDLRAEFIGTLETTLCIAR